MKKLIGTAVIEYDLEGRPSSSSFSPEVYEVGHWKQASDALLQSPPVRTAEDASKQAEIILAGWFSHVTEIELADRETATIESKVEECIPWEHDKSPKKCVISFWLVPR